MIILLLLHTTLYYTKMEKFNAFRICLFICSQTDGWTKIVGCWAVAIIFYGEDDVLRKVWCILLIRSIQKTITDFCIISI